MKVKNVALETVCGITSTLPRNEAPEFAFAGRSNVGKSSLINALMMRKSFARTSSEPGKTHTINYYRIQAEQDLYFVDLPGYGYAKVSKTTQEKWGKMIEKYLRTSKQLKAVFLLVDIRHEPSAGDKMMFEWIRANDFENVIVIATKSDKIGRSQIPSHLKVIRNSLGMRKTDLLIPFSATSKAGREEIYAFMDGILSGDAADSSDSVDAEVTDNGNKSTAESSETADNGNIVSTEKAETANNGNK